MKFWDASAVVRLVVDEPLSVQLRAHADDDPGIAVWWSTRTECVSAITRRVREGSLTDASARHARSLLRALAEGWSEVQPRERLRASAERLLAVHDLRAADALQLAAALDWCDGSPDGAALVAVDARLRTAALREGFAVLPD